MDGAAPRAAVRSLPADVAEGAVCNSGDSLAGELPPNGRLLWYMRHGQSTGNAARIAAEEADRSEGGGQRYQAAYLASAKFIDCQLTAAGRAEADTARAAVAAWRHRPALVVVSPLTRALQTAAIVFEQDLLQNAVRLVVRPELREFYPDNNENQGRPLAELRACPQLQALRAWPALSMALADAAAASWCEAWDGRWARGGSGAWQAHCGGSARLRDFAAWLDEQPEARVAIVCHYGTINNLLNSEPWADGLPRSGDPSRWPCGGLAHTFRVPNCGWVAVVATCERSSQS